jgi:lysophospholipase L1-like esterase
VELVKPAGVRRIVMLGDSITFGNSVAWNETFSYVLQQLLNGQAGKTTYEVLNLGVSGYNTTQELATLRDLGLKFSPDLIILNVCLNDSDPTKTVAAIGLKNEVGIRDSGDINLRTLVDTSYLLTMLKYALVNTFEKYPQVLRLLNSPDLFINVRTSEKRWGDMKEQMGQIFAVARERQIPIAMVIYPYSSQIGLSPERLVPQQDLLAFAAANGIPALDVSPAYADQPQAMFSDGFVHLSPYGHQVVAAAMRDFLASRGLVPGG